jgi:5-methylcytosine-specific restriction endonuclease McrA
MRRKKKKIKMLTFGDFPIEEVLPLVGTGKQEFHGFKLNFSSNRLEALKKSPFCIQCGIKGSFFRLEKTDKEADYQIHLNMYAVDDNGQEVMLTKDHMVSVYENGTDHPGNLQTLCRKCNAAKGPKPLEETHKQLVRLRVALMDIERMAQGALENPEDKRLGNLHLISDRAKRNIKRIEKLLGLTVSPANKE